MAYEYPKSFARFYDLIYHQLRDGVDNNFFLDQISSTNGRILEIGTGTGRFFLEGINQNADIYGIDNSPAMLEVLKNKLEPKFRNRISLQGITDFKFDFKFDLVIAPFRVFMHLIHKDDQINAINNVYHHLTENGRFIFDMFIPDLNQLVKGFENHKDFEGEYEPGKMVRRFVTTKPDIINQIINITFQLEWDDLKSVQKEIWELPLRFFFRYELEHLIERSEFKKYKILGDYEGNQLNTNSREFIVIGEK